MVSTSLCGCTEVVWIDARTHDRDDLDVVADGLVDHVTEDAVGHDDRWSRI